MFFFIYFQGGFFFFFRFCLPGVVCSKMIPWDGWMIEGVCPLGREREHRFRSYLPRLGGKRAVPAKRITKSINTVTAGKEETLSLLGKRSSHKNDSRKVVHLLPTSRLSPLQPSLGTVNRASYGGYRQKFSKWARYRQGARSGAHHPLFNIPTRCTSRSVQKGICIPLASMTACCRRGIVSTRSLRNSSGIAFHAVFTASRSWSYDIFAG